MIIKKADRVRHENSEKCIAYEYPMEEKDINIAYVEVNGRYPDEGWAVNEVVKELIFVSGGEGKLTLGEEQHELSEGDAILIVPKRKYYFEGNLKMVISSSPAWSPDQHKQIK